MIRWLTETRVSPHPLHPGTADLYDALEGVLGDLKVLGPTSMAKVQSPDGPSRRYKVQMLLYAAGFRNFGLPVKRIALIALPRTAATLDSMYVWGHDCGPDDDLLVEEVLGHRGTKADRHRDPERKHAPGRCPHYPRRNRMLFLFQW